MLKCRKRKNKVENSNICLICKLDYRCYRHKWNGFVALQGRSGCAAYAKKDPQILSTHANVMKMSYTYVFMNISSLYYLNLCSFCYPTK